MATKGVKLKDSNNNVILPVTSSDLIEVNYGGTSKILTNLLEENESVTAEALVDLNSRLADVPANISVSGTSASITDGTIFVPYAEISYQLQMSNTSDNGGAIIGAISYNYNRGSSNIVTSPIKDNYGTDGTPSIKSASGLKYETPLMNFYFGSLSGTTTFPPTLNTSTVNKNYYDPIKQPAKKANVFGTTSSSIAYSNLVLGNNYCDVAHSPKEMYYYDGVAMRNYLTAYARIDRNSPQLKEINSDAILQWGSYTSTSQTYETLTLEKTCISFEKKLGTSQVPIGWSTSITQGAVQTRQLKVYNTALNSNLNTSTRVEVNGTNIQIVSSGTTKANISTTAATFSIPAYATKYYETSDERIKNNINQITYYPNDINIYSFVKNDYSSYSYGFIAQNVANTHPELVSYNESYLSVDYNSTLSLLLARALNRIDELEQRLSELENKIK